VSDPADLLDARLRVCLESGDLLEDCGESGRSQGAVCARSLDPWPVLGGVVSLGDYSFFRHFLEQWKTYVKSGRSPEAADFVEDTVTPTKVGETSGTLVRERGLSAPFSSPDARLLKVPATKDKKKKKEKTGGPGIKKTTGGIKKTLTKVEETSTCRGLKTINILATTTGGTRGGLAGGVSDIPSLSVADSPRWTM